MKKASASSSGAAGSSKAHVSKRSSAKKRSSVNQASKRPSINQASKRSSVNAARQSTINGIAEVASDDASKAPLFNVNRVPVASTGPRGSLPAHFPNKEWGNANRILREKSVDEFLAVHPQVLLDFMYDTVELDTLDDILRHKKGVIEDEDDPRSKQLSRQAKYAAQTLFDQDSTNLVATSLIAAVQRDQSLHGILENYCHFFSKIVHADAYNLYVQEGLNTNSYFLLRDGQLDPCDITGTAAGRARKKRKPVLVSALDQNVDGRGEISANSSVMCVPLILPSKEIPAIIEVSRDHHNIPFIETDLQIASAAIGWIAACVGEHIGKRSLISQQHLIDFLLENTKGLFDGVTQTEELVPTIMHYTKDLVKADRCALFLLDEERGELYATHFDDGATSSIGTPVFVKKDMIRFPKDTGIAGHVAMTGEVVNIPDVYEDPRFNKEVDKLTGYRTRNILCIPIISRNCITGVIQMVNSRRFDSFSESDENALRMFTVYCAIALHYNSFYNSLEKQKARNRTCIEVIQYHTVCHKSSCTDLMNNPHIQKADIPKSFYTYDFYAPINTGILPELFLHMAEDVCGKDRFEAEKFVKFILTVRKNYRNVAYHNFPHGFHVAHCLWRMISTSPRSFTAHEKMGLVVAGICHDVDHRGYNNEFFKKLDLPLANLYSTSVMEQHHYRQTVTILQTEDIFSFLSSEKYKEMLGLIRHCILATDLSLNFATQKTIQRLLDEGTFDLKNAQCFRLAMDLMMTASDLSGMAKRWRTTRSSTNQLYEEFYDQGDEERKRGFEPMTMMDRACSDNIPNQQVGFIDAICIPLYRTMVRILPGTQNLLSGILRNRRKWVKITENNDVLKAKKQLPYGLEDEEDVDSDEDTWVNVFTVKKTSNQTVPATS